MSPDRDAWPSRSAEPPRVSRPRLISPWWFPPGATVVMFGPPFLLHIDPLQPVLLFFALAFYVLGLRARARTIIKRDKKIIGASLLAPVLLYGIWFVTLLVFYLSWDSIESRS